MSRTANNSTKQDGLLKPDEHFIGRIDTPYGVHLIKKGEALDHASMRAKQLNGLLLLATADGFDVFDGLSSTPKHDLLWFAQQMAMELAEMVHLVDQDAKGSVA